jgi:hypothetical protein
MSQFLSCTIPTRLEELVKPLKPQNGGFPDHKMGTSKIQSSVANHYNLPLSGVANGSASFCDIALVQVPILCFIVSQVAWHLLGIRIGGLRPPGMEGIAVIILSKQSRTADKGCMFSVGIERDANNSSLQVLRLKFCVDTF